MAQDSAFLLDFNLVFGYGLIFFTSSVNLIVSVNFSVNFADTFQLILFIDYDIGIDHIERTKSADAAFLGEATDEICTEYVNQVVNVMKEQGLVQE